ncbi:Sporulation protein rmd8, partial [Apiospora phragmitis]
MPSLFGTILSLLVLCWAVSGTPVEANGVDILLSKLPDGGYIIAVDENGKPFVHTNLTDDSISNTTSIAANPSNPAVTNYSRLTPRTKDQWDCIDGEVNCLGSDLDNYMAEIDTRCRSTPGNYASGWHLQGSGDKTYGRGLANSKGSAEKTLVAPSCLFSGRRGPSMLVTDSRQRPASRSAQPLPVTATGAPPRMSSMRFISVDNVLQYASEIPSGQPRLPPGVSPRAVSGARRISGGGLPNLASRTGQHNIPSRTSRISEKLVLLPVTDEDEEILDDEGDGMIEEEDRPLKDDERDMLNKRGALRGKSYAERLPKVQRAEKLSRLTAYCTAQSYKIKATSEFLRKEARCEDETIRRLLSPGTGKTVVDLEIERNEQRDEHMGYYDEYGYGQSPSPTRENGHHRSASDDSNYDAQEASNNPTNHHAPDAKQFAEMFVFSYGVVVFWNFTEQQEKNILADLAFAENESGVSLVTRPLEQNDFETEEFHFEYNANIKRPRIFNDMITLLPRSDHMVKLTISHAIAQSTKLCFFEERMSETMLNAQHVPKRLALTGDLSMTRTEILKILGRLFKSRVDINLLLNERCRVFLDLAEILSDSVADAKMSAITWIVIVLIIISILVTVTEVALRFAILSKEKENSNGGNGNAADILRVKLHGAIGNASLAELKLWSAGLSEQQRGA